MQRIYRVTGDACPHPLAACDAAMALRAGNLALLPTETVYGVGVSVAAYAGCDELPPECSGYRRIFSLKRRDIAQTVPWLVSGPEALDEYGVDITPQTRRLAEEFWPGALTLIVRAAPGVPTFMQAADGTVALRASASPTIRALVHMCKSPLAVTSANTHGAPAPISFDAVESRILAGVDIAIDGGPTPCRDASTIVSCLEGELEILRHGALSDDRIRSVFESDPQ